jgi:rubrerythrin
MAKANAKSRTKKPQADRETVKLVKLLQLWQEIEKKSIESTAGIMKKTDNPLVRQLMDIIRNDSMQHHRVQQFLVETLTKRSVSLTKKELDLVWAEIEAHDEMERAAIEIAAELKKKCRTVEQQTLLDYLLLDEEKHDVLIGRLEQFRKDAPKRRK